MAYEVIKRRGKRAYRYSVEYYHDADGKGKTRWLYVGPVGDGSEPLSTTPKVHKKSQQDTAGRLLDALERLLARSPYTEITASAIAIEAEVAHGTFYRHFKDKRDALRASMQRLTERAEHLAHLDAPGEDLERERTRIRDWIIHKLATVSEYPTVWRAWAALAERDEHVTEVRRVLRNKYRGMLQDYLEQLRTLGHSTVTDTYSLSQLVFAIMYGVLQDRFVHVNDMPTPEIIEQVCLMLDRTIFGMVPNTAVAPLVRASETSIAA
jgi:AcrR family transcriptional regulator